MGHLSSSVLIQFSFLKELRPTPVCLGVSAQILLIEVTPEGKQRKPISSTPPRPAPPPPQVTRGGCECALIIDSVPALVVSGLREAGLLEE